MASQHMWYIGAGARSHAFGKIENIGSGDGDSGVRVQSGPLMVHFSVRDTGIGISSEDLKRLFQSFSQV